MTDDPHSAGPMTDTVPTTPARPRISTEDVS